jgi:hypothetical protein
MNNYFYLKPGSKEESAALIAALTRFLNYPRGEVFLTNVVQPEIWWNSGSMTLSLNDTSRNAIINEFGYFQYVLGDSPEKLNGYRRLFEQGEIIPLGIEEATNLLNRN